MTMERAQNLLRYAGKFVYGRKRKSGKEVKIAYMGNLLGGTITWNRV